MTTQMAGVSDQELVQIGRSTGRLLDATFEQLDRVSAGEVDPAEADRYVSGAVQAVHAFGDLVRAHSALRQFEAAR
jgi:hypothetical protein